MSTTQATGQVATAAVNEVTGARLVSRAPTDAYRSNYDAIAWTKDEKAVIEHFVKNSFKREQSDTEGGATD